MGYQLHYFQRVYADDWQRDHGRNSRKLSEKHSVSGPCRDQLLPFFKRHGPVADSSDLSDLEGIFPSRFRADRFDHAYIPVHRVAVAAGGGPLYRLPSQAVLAVDRNGIHAGRSAAVF